MDLSDHSVPVATPDVDVHEVEPITEEKEDSGAGCVRDFAHLATHSEVKNFFFGEDLLLRRTTTTSAFQAAFLPRDVYDYVEADSLHLPTKRRAFMRGPDDRVIKERLMSLD